MRILYCMILILCISSIHAQSYRPKVGLALSGGSARGLAHIGVIKYMEELEIPVDYVTGTSMGAIVGGLYAMGYTASDIERIARAQQWDEIMSNDIPLDRIAPSEKRYHERHALHMTIDDGRVALPQSIINGHRLDLVLTRLYSGVYNLDSFDDLPRPFRCVAVDIESGDIKTFDQGFLAEAVRASMAIPTLFLPVEVDGRLYVDGGLRRNFPVDENRALGSDLVIGVYVGSILEERDELTSLTGILGQAAFMMGALDSEDQKTKTDVLIEPDVYSYSSFSFDDIDRFMELGYEAAKANHDELMKLKAKLNGFDIAPVTKLRSHDAFDVKSFRFRAGSDPFDRLSKFKFGKSTSGLYPLDDLEHALERIYGTRHYAHARYVILDEATGGKQLQILTPPRIGIDLYANINYLPTSGTSVLLRGELRSLLGSPSVLTATGRLSENYAFGLDYYYRIGPHKDYILTLEGEIDRHDVYGYQDDVLRADYHTIETHALIGFAHEPNNTFWIGAKGGLKHRYLTPKGTMPQGLRRYWRTDVSAQVFAEHNSLNKHAWPSHGWRLKAVAEYVNLQNRTVRGGSSVIEMIPRMKHSYAKACLSIHRAQPIGSRLTLDLSANAGYKSNPSLLDNYIIGGIEARDGHDLQVYGMRTDQLHADRYAQAGAELRLQISDGWYLSGRYDQLAARRAFLYQNDDDPKRITWQSYGGMIGYMSPIGPIKLAYGYNDYTDTFQSNLTIGYSFF